MPSAGTRRVLRHEAPASSLQSTLGGHDLFISLELDRFKSGQRLGDYLCLYCRDLRGQRCGLVDPIDELRSRSWSAENDRYEARRVYHDVGFRDEGRKVNSCLHRPIGETGNTLGRVYPIFIEKDAIPPVEQRALCAWALLSRRAAASTLLW